MSLLLGVNIPTRTKRTDPIWDAETAKAGAEIVRLVAVPSTGLVEVIDKHNARGQKVLLVLTPQSFGHRRPTYEDIESYAPLAKKVWGWQWWNEPDGEGVESSTETPDFINLGGGWVRKIVKAANPKCLVIAPGFIRGQPDLLAPFDFSFYDALAIHPYWHGDDLGWFIEQHRTYAPGKPVVITEKDPDPVAALRCARLPYVVALIFYCWQAWDRWDRAFVDRAGRPLDDYETCLRARRFIMADDVAELKAQVATLTKKLGDAEDRIAKHTDLTARVLSGQWDEGAESAEALLRTISPGKYGNFEATRFPKS